MRAKRSEWCAFCQVVSLARFYVLVKASDRMSDDPIHGLKNCIFYAIELQCIRKEMVTCVCLLYLSITMVDCHCTS